MSAAGRRRVIDDDDPRGPAGQHFECRLDRAPVDLANDNRSGDGALGRLGPTSFRLLDPPAVDADATSTQADATSHVAVCRRSTAIDHLPVATLPCGVHYLNRIGLPCRTRNAHGDITSARNCFFNLELNLVTALRSKSRNPSTIELDIWLVMQAVKSSLGSFRFGHFELDPRTGDLLGNGTTQRLADQPLALLIALLERPGELITRDELRLRLWPDGTFVDFDHGLNSAVNRLREALHDTANSPRFVETVPRRGYRLLVPVTSPGTQPLESSAGSAPAVTGND